jgi:hypothetical protein
MTIEYGSVKADWQKFYFVNLALFGTVALMFGSLYILQAELEVGFFLANIVAFFAIVYARSIFDPIFIYDAPLSKMQFKKNILFAALSALILVLMLCLLRTFLGEWAIFVMIALSQKIMLKLRSLLFSSTTQSGGVARSQLFEKITVYTKGLYSFFGATAVLSYFGVALLGTSSFSLVFCIALFIALLLHMLFEVTTMYHVTVTQKILLQTIAVSVLGALATSALFCVFFGYTASGKASTIMAIIVLKLIQPWWIRRTIVQSTVA